jgi:hypothetical protein
LSEGADLPSDLRRRWIVANAISMLVIAACGFAGYGLRAALEMESAETGGDVRAFYIAAEIVLSVVSFVVYARLTAGVLRMMLPALPWRSWIAIHAVMGLVSGPVTGLLGAMPAGGEPADWSDKFLTTFVFVAFAVLGAVVGAAVGGVQALVLRKVAEGTGVWIRISALSTSVLFTLVLGAQAIAPQGRALFTEVVSETALVLAGIATAVIMLHALANLRPKTD